MNIKKYMSVSGEKPLDNIVSNGGLCAIFRKIACIGDSLSSGELESYEIGKRGYHDYFEYSWGQFIARDAGCEVYNFSRGGMSAREYFETFADEKDFWSRDLACQAYIIALGANDVTDIIADSYELGNAGDINISDYTQNRPTFAGWYGAIISKYKEIEPHAKFFLMTIPRGNRAPERTELYDRHAQLIYDIAEKFSNCHVLDFRKYAPVCDEDFYERFFVGGHMNVMGYRLAAQMVESYIDYIIRNDYKNFKQSGFIGKPHYFGM